MKTSIKKTQITSDTKRVPLPNFSQSAVVNKVIRRLLSIMSERDSPRASYTAAFKLHVVLYAVSHGNHAAGRQFSTDENSAHHWRSQHERLLKTPRNKRVERFQGAAFPDIEKEVVAWITIPKVVSVYLPMSSASKQRQLRRSLVLPKNHLKHLNAGAMDLWSTMVFPYDGEQ